MALQEHSVSFSFDAPEWDDLEMEMDGDLSYEEKVELATAFVKDIYPEAINIEIESIKL